MKYMGSKLKISKDILRVISEYRRDDEYFIDLFCGGLNIVDKVKGKRIASDNNKYLIAMWRSLRDGKVFPKNISKGFYDEVRKSFNLNDGSMSDDLIGWVGFMASFNGRFFDGGYSGKTKDRDYIDEQIRNTLKQVSLIQDVEFVCGDYSEVNTPCGIIYCDIPYKGTKQYSTSKNFNHEKFWQWCRDKSKTHKVFVSEYSAPDDFSCIWSKQVTNSLNSRITYKPTEKLFII